MVTSKIEVLENNIFYVVNLENGCIAMKNITSTLKLLTGKDFLSANELQKIYKCMNHDKVYKADKSIYFSKNMYKLLYSACEKSKLLK